MAAGGTISSKLADAARSYPFGGCHGRTEDLPHRGHAYAKERGGPCTALGYPSCFLPAFLAAAHLFFMANASRFRPAGLIAPRRGVAVRFDAVPAPLARFSAQRLLVASMILLRPSGLRCLLRGWTLRLGDVTFAKGLFPATSRRADMARSMADRCVSS